MMKNKISDLRNHMFAALERLGNEDLDKEKLALEIQRSQAIADVGKIVVESAKSEILYAKLNRKMQDAPTKFLEIPEPEIEAEKKVFEKGKFERPKAEYTNPSFQ